MELSADGNIAKKKKKIIMIEILMRKLSSAAICHGNHSTLFRAIQENIQHNKNPT